MSAHPSRSSGDDASTNKRSRSSNPHAPRPSHGAPTVRDLITDELAPLANQYWAPGASSLQPYSAAIIENIYQQHLAPINSVAERREKREAATAAKESSEKKSADEDEDASMSTEELSAEDIRHEAEDEEREQTQIEAQRTQRLVLLELSAYLENYLWPNFSSSTSSFSHVMSILILTNQKFKENLLNIWDCFSSRSDDVLLELFDRVLHLKQDHDLSVYEAYQFLTFLIHAYQSFEHPLVRKVFMRLATIDCWRSMRDSSIIKVMREAAMNESAAPTATQNDTTSLRAIWTKVESKPTTDLNAIFLPNLIIEFVHILYSIDDSSPIFSYDTATTRRLPYATRHHIQYLERFLEFLTDCLTKRSTRRWVRKLLEDIHLIVLCKESPLVRRTQAKELEIQAKQEELARSGGKGATSTSGLSRGSDDIDMTLLQASSSVSGGAILSNTNYSNTNQSLSSSVLLPGRLFVQLLQILEYYQHFEVDDITGASLSSATLTHRHHLDIGLLQKVCFKYFSHVPELKQLAMRNVSELEDASRLRERLQVVPKEQLHELCVKLLLLPRAEEVEEYRTQQIAPTTTSKSKSKAAAPFVPSHVPRTIVSVLDHTKSSSFLLTLLVSTFQLRRNTLQEIQAMPLYPNESLLFDEHSIPSMNYTGESCLSLPKLNLQFLTLHDYLQRNFKLYKGESTYEIREDIAYTIKRMKPRVANDGSGNTLFTGWARMASPVSSFKVTQVAKALIGETKPSSVRAEVTVDLALFNGVVKEEWEALRAHDVLFLISVQALVPINASIGTSFTRQPAGGEDSGRRKFDVEGSDLESGQMLPDESFRALQAEPLFIRHVRGCRVRSVLDQYKKVIGERDEKGNEYRAKGTIRTYRVELDAAQYAEDQQQMLAASSSRTSTSSSSDIYASFNLLLRRKPKENNFAGVLETIRDLMDDTNRGTATIPTWLRNVFLGYGDPKESAYYRLKTQMQKLEFVDTFLDLQHLKESFHESVEIAERTTEEIEAELKGEKDVTLMALSGEGNNRQTAASTSLALTRQVMRLVNAATKEKNATSSDTTSSTFRLTFPLGVEPDLTVLQKLLYAHDSTLASSVAHTDPNLRFVLGEGEGVVKVAEEMEKEKSGETEEKKEEKDQNNDDEEEEPVAPEFEPLVEPIKPTSSAAAASSSTTSSAASSTDIEAQIAELSHLTVVKLKDQLKDRGLAQAGAKAVLIERLSEAMRADGASSTSTTDAAAASASTSAEEVSPEALAQYEAAKAEYERKKSTQEAAQKAYELAVKEWKKKQKASKKKKASGEKKLDGDGDATMEDAPSKPSSGKKGKKSKSNSEAAAQPTASTTPPTSASSNALTIPPSPHKLTVELLPRVQARHASSRRNHVRFTPIQVEAIKSGLNPGLTMIVGPPGTGKTDTAVQIISELYHNFPEQRTLLITHSNHALNDLFEKIMQRDIDERYLLRLGRGSDELDSTNDMSKFGRVNYMLQRRLTLLEEVAHLARSMQINDGVASTCETSGHFFASHILGRWEKFTAVMQAAQKNGTDSQANTALIAAHFPFTTYFTQRTEKYAKIWQQYYQSQLPATPSSGDAEMTDASATSSIPSIPSTSLFRSSSFSEDMSIAVSCFAELQTIFIELEETRPFELLRSYKDRSNYLLTKHAKIIAMTCTHAAIKRSELIELKFKYDNIIMEEAAQILDIETFIPILLQRNDVVVEGARESGGANILNTSDRLQRIILLGDHHQLPPVIKNRSFQKFSHFDQSLFTRLIRLGLPYIQLNAQGRMRTKLAELWNWNYTNLGNLPSILHSPSYQHANVGFVHDYQMINVEDLNGVGESSPTPFFYQNLAEAEYVVQVFMYMRLLGYAANRITILTTYNGQKHLIRDILQQRCASNLLFGLPAKVSTVDKYQGQQNDYILLSLVRTRAAGHIRDIRRLVVAMSRARLGLYIFGRISLFTNSYELTRTFNQLMKKSVRLQILPQEKRPYDQMMWTERKSEEVVDPAKILEVRDVVHMGELIASMTLSVQSEYTVYAHRIQAAQEEERQQRMKRDQAQRQYEEAVEAMRRQEAQEAAQQAESDALSAEADVHEAERMEEDGEKKKRKKPYKQRSLRGRAPADDDLSVDESGSEPEQDE